MHLQDSYELRDGQEIPIVGFGTYQLPDNQRTADLVERAIEVGYRHIDTAAEYENEKSVGLGIQQAIEKGFAKREDLFVTTKLFNDDHGYERTKKAIVKSLDLLGLDYLDLYLIHWPNPMKYRENWQESNKESWRAMERAQAEGKIRSLGVSNFMPRHLKALLEDIKVKPTVNQIMLNPSEMQKESVAENEKHEILSVAWSPLGSGKIFEIDELKEIARRYDKSVGQIVLRWSLQKGFLPLPKTATFSRIEENADLFDFELSETDMEKMNQFEGQAGTMWNPDEIDF